MFVESEVIFLKIVILLDIVFIGFKGFLFGGSLLGIMGLEVVLLLLFVNDNYV